MVYLVPFFTFLCFWWVILLFKMTSEHKMLFCAPEYKKSAMCLMEKIHVSSSSIRHES